MRVKKNFLVIFESFFKVSAFPCSVFLAIFRFCLILEGTETQPLKTVHSEILSAIYILQGDCNLCLFFFFFNSRDRPVGVSLLRVRRGRMTLELPVCAGGSHRWKFAN